MSRKRRCTVSAIFRLTSARQGIIDPVVSKLRTRSIGSDPFICTYPLHCLDVEAYYHMTFTKTPMVKTCENCGAEFRPVLYIDGVRIPLYRRKTCYDCVPYTPTPRGRNRVLFYTVEKGGKRPCKICREYKPLSQFSPTNKKGTRSSYCKPCAASKRRSSSQRFKQECVDYKGGVCQRCGYNTCIAAIDFHHRDMSKKEFSLSKLHTTKLTSRVKKELDKCDLLCANCHREAHYMNPSTT